jgi:hypothetical protein
MEFVIIDVQCHESGSRATTSVGDPRRSNASGLSVRRLSLAIAPSITIRIPVKLCPRESPFDEPPADRADPMNAFALKS